MPDRRFTQPPPPPRRLPSSESTTVLGPLLWYLSRHVHRLDRGARLQLAGAVIDAMRRLGVDPDECP